MSDECPSEQVFMDFALGLLDVASAQNFEHHLTQCRDCALVFAEIGRIDSAERSNLRTPQAQRIGRYELVQVLGSGGQGVIWQAQDTMLKRDVALKLLLPDVQDATPNSSQIQKRSQRLLREARALAALFHPHILTVFDVGEDQGRVWLATELLSGQTLEGSSAPWTDKLELLLQIAQALEAAHAAGIVHGDLKPANILLRSPEHAVLADFGLATPNLTLAHSQAHSPLSQTRSVGGTPYYMAPELLSGHAPTPASDQYAFCITAYELLFGMRPFVGDSITALAHAATTSPIPKPRNTKVPHALFEVLSVGLSPSPQERFDDMRALEDALIRASAKPARWPKAIALVALVGILLAALALGPARDWLAALVAQDPPAPPIADKPATAPTAAAINEACIALASVQLTGALKRAQAAAADVPAPKPKPKKARPAKSSEENGFEPFIPSAWTISCSPNHTKIEPCLKSIKRLDQALKPYGGDIGYLKYVRANPSFSPAERNRLISDHRALLGGAYFLMLNAESCVHAYELYERYLFLQLNITPREPPYEKLNTSRQARAEFFKEVYAKCAHGAP